MEAVSLVIALLILGALSTYRNGRQRRLPPGPRGLPIVGNAWNMPKEFEWHTYEKWSRDLDSDVIHLSVFGTSIVVLNSAKATNDLLDKRSTLYSDRAHMVMLLELVGWERAIGFLRCGDEWREHRRLFHQHFRSTAITEYHPKMSKEAKKLLRILVDKPGDFMKHVRTMAGSIILGITFGIEFQPENDPYVLLAEKALHSMAAVGNAGAYMVDFLPWLKHLPSWIPGAELKREAAEWNQSVTAMYEKPFAFAKQAMSEGNAPPSILASELAKLDTLEDSSRREDVVRNVAGTTYVGGADTMVSTLGSFVLAMLLYPDVQRAAQEEVDRVIGNGRLPDYGDKDTLPYITAMLIETLRWRPVSPLAGPHRLTADDEYNGYDLPAGSIVIGNSWAILHSETRYPNPDAFDPTRHLTSDGKLDKDAFGPIEVAFGYGRRICPGRHFAMDSLWIAIAYLVTTVDIRKAVNENGYVIEPSGAYTPGLVSYPVPFEASFEPRSAAAATLIRSSSSE